jgi:hypothetical protein
MKTNSRERSLACMTILDAPRRNRGMSFCSRVTLAAKDVGSGGVSTASYNIVRRSSIEHGGTVAARYRGN